MTHADRMKIDVAVIGAGIAGLACARELAGAGRKVVLFEETPGRAASWAAAGMLSPWAEGNEGAGVEESEGAAKEEHEGAATKGHEGAGAAGKIAPGPATIEMREAALALYPEWVAGIRSETGMEIEMIRCGSLVVSFSGEKPAVERLASVAGRAPGFRTLTAAEARVEAPLLGPNVQDAVLLPEEGYADPRSIMPALREACRIRGVILREEAALRLIEGGGGVRGVKARTEDVYATAVLNAAGAWAAPFLQGGHVRPIRGQVVSLAPSTGDLRPTRVIQSAKGYLVPRADGSIVVGATSEEAGFGTGVTDSAIRSLLARAAEIAPSLAGWTMRQAWSGLRPYRERGPLIGPDGRRRGLYHVAGLYRHGILLAPYAAMRIRGCMDAA